jgi:hypothetical protein
MHLCGELIPLGCFKISEFQLNFLERKTSAKLMRFISTAVSDADRTYFAVRNTMTQYWLGNTTG